MSKIRVRNRHRYTNEENIIFEGDAIILLMDDCIEIKYFEDDKNFVKAIAHKDYFQLFRQTVELTSNMLFIEKEKTKNKFSTVYGDVEIEIETIKYINDKNRFIIEYDILDSSNEKDGYEVIFEVEDK